MLQRHRRGQVARTRAQKLREEKKKREQEQRKKEQEEEKGALGQEEQEETHETDDEKVPWLFVLLSPSGSSWCPLCFA